ncbi:MAG: nickel-dependent lactate racemase [Synergistaceae bacterium]|jgi:nickel-dependent lactate racemase|nr:nickel-dependent lactate racemase [Synergistaceae bacterium]
MRYSIPYGSSTAYFDAPDESVIFKGEMKNLPAVADLEAAIWDALENPIGTPPLKEIARGKKNILFLVEDSTRSTPLAEIMPVITRYLNEIGVPDGNMSFLTAPGTHRTMTEAEILEKLGGEIVRRFRIYQHDATATGELVDMGFVMAGDYRVPVHINRRVLEADFVFGLGNIIPHSDAGYAGGAKILQPGVCGFATTAATHASSGFCPDIPLGMKDGNPCRKGMEEVASRAGLSFILNVVKNCSGEVCGVFAGDFIEAHRRGVDMAEESFMVGIPERADIVVVSSYPADIDYWQAEKGVIGAYFAVREGGIIIFAAPCPEGLATNHPRLREWLSKPLVEVLDGLRSHSAEDEDADLVSAVLAVCNCRTRDRADIYIVTDGLDDLDIAALQYRRFESVQAALDEAMKKIPGATIGILPQGAISLPVIR